MKTRLVLVALGFGLVATPASADDWPQWRGPNRDNKVEGFKTPASWPKELSKKWKVTVGLGDASPVLVGDKIYTFTRVGNDEIITCLDAASGAKVWEEKYGAVQVGGAARQHPGPRSTPVVAEGKVCTFGVGGVLSCLDAGTGKVAWRTDTKEYPRFFTSSSPLIAEGNCICCLGDDNAGALKAFDLKSGDVKWTRADDGAPYGSPVLMTIDGVKSLVTLTKKSIIGVNVADGKELWKVPFAANYNSNTPVIVGDKVIYSGNGKGTTALKIEKQGDGYTAKKIWEKSQAPGQYNSFVVKDGSLFSITQQGSLFCMNAETGEMLWTDAKRRGTCGAVLDIGTAILALTDNMELVAFKPNPKEYTELAKYKVADSATWAYPILAGNRIFVKDKDAVTLWTIE
jgi:outer membrane protein assembly factor BamB